jgi:hypothetical protein
MKFEMKGTAGIESPKEMHMHAIKLTYNDPNTLTQEWTHYENGKPSAKPAVFTFKRVTK